VGEGLEPADRDRLKLGTSVRFPFPTSPATHERFRSLLASMPKGAFIERPMGAYAPDEQAHNLMEVAAAARAAGRRYRAMGFDYVMVRHIIGDHPLMLRSFERIGRDVMPQIRDL